jgi:hypothetical protein
VKNPLDSVPALLADSQAKSPIRAELLAQDRTYGSTKDIPIEILFKIEKVAQYMEAKGRQKQTVKGFKKHIKRLARIANLQQTSLTN